MQNAKRQEFDLFAEIGLAPCDHTTHYEDMPVQTPLKVDDDLWGAVHDEVRALRKLPFDLCLQTSYSTSHDMSITVRSDVVQKNHAPQ